MTNIFIKTYGCAFNKIDSEVMSGILKEKNYSIVYNDKEADIVVINSCTVKNSAETKLFNDIKRYKEQNKKIIVGGCIPQAEVSYLNSKLKNIPVIGINDLDKIDLVVSDILANKTSHILTPLNKNKDTRLGNISGQFEQDSNNEEKEKLRLFTKRKKDSNIIEIIPINEGCLSACTYCKTRYARGTLYSYKIKNIKKAMQIAINNGATEIYLTSQDTACYGFDIGTNLGELLKELLTIPGDYKIRIGMGNPNHFVKIIDDVLDIMKDDNRIYKFLHIPMQSGDDRILKEMRRQNSVAQYLEIIEKCRKQIPKITIANDIIVAYPTETESEFKNTLEIMKKGGTDVLNFSRFWLRPNTPADKYKKNEFIDGTESKNRAKTIKSEFEQLGFQQNSNWLNWEGNVKIIEKGKEGTNSMIGRNDYYKPIVVLNSSNQLKIGDKVKIKIIEVTWFDFRAEIVE